MANATGRTGGHGSGTGHGTGHGTGPRGFGARGGSLRDTLDGLREAVEQRAGTRMGRGDVRAAILALLAESPMHGYQIIREVDERSNGAWKPSAGSVYPTLQLLADEGLVSVEEAGGKKRYSLTDTGTKEAEAAEGLPWENGASDRAARLGALPKSGARLMQAVGQLAMDGTPEQVEQAVAIIDEARRKIYALLAEA